MRKLFLFFLMLQGLTVAAQTVRISGKFQNCTEKTLEFIARSGDGETTEKIPVNEDGSFSFETKVVNKPMQGNITNRKQIQVQLFLAPGYDLNINADVSDYNTFKSSVRYSGLGGRSNTYWEVINRAAARDTVNWNKKDIDTYVRHVLEKPRFAFIRDSIFGPENTEPYKDFFKRSMEIDEQFGPVLSLFNAYAYENNYSWKQIEAALQKMGKKDLFKEVNNPENLNSGAFRYFAEQLPFYCETYNAFPADSLLKKESKYTLYLASKIYTGPVYDYVATQNMERSLSSTYKFDDIKKFTPYVHLLSPEKKAKIEALIKAREATASELQAGMPSPGFKLADPAGKFFSLADFKGKVVYIDLWASWCGPCREENPYLKKIYSDYKNNNNIAFISIAAFDAKNRDQRYEIMKKEQMEWLQLEDTDDAFAKSYQASFIPRFIIIDKKGNIVDSDAPRPSDGKTLTAILDREIRK